MAMVTVTRKSLQNTSSHYLWHKELFYVVRDVKWEFTVSIAIELAWTDWKLRKKKKQILGAPCWRPPQDFRFTSLFHRWRQSNVSKWKMHVRGVQRGQKSFLLLIEYANLRCCRCYYVSSLLGSLEHHRRNDLKSFLRVFTIITYYPGIKLVWAVWKLVEKIQKSVVKCSLWPHNLKTDHFTSGIRPEWLQKEPQKGKCSCNKFKVCETTALRRSCRHLRLACLSSLLSLE